MISGRRLLQAPRFLESGVRSPSYFSRSARSFRTRSVYRFFGTIDVWKRVERGSMGGADLHVEFSASG
jgi:hypothetical protein